MATRVALRSIAQRGACYAIALTGIAGCGSLNSMLEPDRIDYKSAGKASTFSLEIPPDLTQLQRDNRYAIPDTGNGTATASGYHLQQGAQAAMPVAVIAPTSTSDMRIERAGMQRWLVVQQTPEALWPQLKDFWQDSGFIIQLDSPNTGVMETDWAENRAKVPQDSLRNTLGKAFDSLYSTGERDKFRTRIERGAEGSTEIYISHRGMQEVLTGKQKETTIWTPRSADPDLEAEFLSRLMARLGTDSARAKAMIVSAVPQPAHAQWMKDRGYLEVDEEFDRAWRRVGLALDRVGFTVEDRDRTQGLYFVRYVELNQDAGKNADKGFLSRLFSGTPSDDKAKAAQRYQILVKGAGTNSHVSVLNHAGKPETSPTVDKILSLLSEQLK